MTILDLVRTLQPLVDRMEGDPAERLGKLFVAAALASGANGKEVVQASDACTVALAELARAAAGGGPAGIQ